MGYKVSSEESSEQFEGKASLSWFEIYFGKRCDG